jgi:hypothetical protein
VNTLRLPAVHPPAIRRTSNRGPVRELARKVGWVMFGMAVTASVASGLCAACAQRVREL